VGGQERLAVFRTLEAQPQVWYTLSNDREADRGVLGRVHGDRHRVEELLGQGKQEVGLSHYEVRSWTGWHHHMTLSLLALWFLQLERLGVGKKKSGANAVVDPGHLHGVAASAAAEGAGGGAEGKCEATADGGSAD